MKTSLDLVLDSDRWLKRCQFTCKVFTSAAKPRVKSDVAQQRNNNFRNLSDVKQRFIGTLHFHVCKKKHIQLKYKQV